jgi:ubiquinone/menaquinone biosynthesis C-methylase UbiE
MLSRRILRVAVSVFGLVLFAGIGYALWWRLNPSPCPYSQRRWVTIPRPIITRAKVRDLLDPQSGEQILELGPGTGYYTNNISTVLKPNGRLHAVDVQHAMLEYIRTTEEHDERVQLIQGDGRTLPYPDDYFDGAYLILVLGEIPDQEQALSELERVLKPDGRLVVGELLPDPHFVTRRALKQRTERQGFRFETYVGTPFGYVARLVPSEPSTINTE